MFSLDPLAGDSHVLDGDEGVFHRCDVRRGDELVEHGLAVAEASEFSLRHHLEGDTESDGGGGVMLVMRTSNR